MGDRDRRSGARAGDRVARLPHRGERPAGAGRGQHPRGHAGRARRRARRAAVRADRDFARSRRKWRSSRKCWPAPARRSCCSAAAAGRKRPATASGALRRNMRCRCAPRSAAPICSTRCIPATPAISASVPIQSCSSASSRPIWSSWSAAGSANCRRRAIRCSTFRGRRCRSSMCIRAPKSSAASTVRTWQSMRRRPRLPRRSTISI